MYMNVVNVYFCCLGLETALTFKCDETGVYSDGTGVYSDWTGVYSDGTGVYSDGTGTRI